MALGKLIVEDRKYRGTEATEIAASEHYRSDQSEKNYHFLVTWCISN